MAKVLVVTAGLSSLISGQSCWPITRVTDTEYLVTGRLN